MAKSLPITDDVEEIDKPGLFERIAAVFPWKYHIHLTLGRIKKARVGFYMSQLTTEGLLYIESKRPFTPLSGDVHYVDLPKLTSRSALQQGDGDPTIDNDFLTPHKARWCDGLIVLSIPETTMEMIPLSKAAEIAYDVDLVAAGKLPVSEAGKSAIKGRLPEDAAILRQDAIKMANPANVLLVRMPKRLVTLAKESVSLTGACPVSVLPDAGLVLIHLSHLLKQSPEEFNNGKCLVAIVADNKFYIATFKEGKLAMLNSIETSTSIGATVVAVQQACTMMTINDPSIHDVPLYIWASSSQQYEEISKIFSKAYHRVVDNSIICPKDSGASDLMRFFLQNNALVDKKFFLNKHEVNRSHKRTGPGQRFKFFSTLAAVAVISVYLMTLLVSGGRVGWDLLIDQLQKRDIIHISNSDRPMDNAEIDKLIKSNGYEFVREPEKPTKTVPETPKK